MRAPGIGIRNIGSVRSRPLFQAPKHNEFEGPISDAKRKVFQIWFVRLFFRFFALNFLIFQVRSLRIPPSTRLVFSIRERRASIHNPKEI